MDSANKTATILHRIENIPTGNSKSSYVDPSDVQMILTLFCHRRQGLSDTTFTSADVCTWFEAIFKDMIHTNPIVGAWFKLFRSPRSLCWYFKAHKEALGISYKTKQQNEMIWQHPKVPEMFDENTPNTMSRYEAAELLTEIMETR